MALSKTINTRVGVDATYIQIDSFRMDIKVKQAVISIGMYPSITEAADRSIKPLMEEQIVIDGADFDRLFVAADFSSLITILETHMKTFDRYSGATTV